MYTLFDSLTIIKKMSLIKQVVAEIDRVGTTMSESEHSFNKLSKRYVYFQDFKITLIEDAETRSIKYQKVLEECERRRQQCYEYGFGPIHEPIYGDVTKWMIHARWDSPAAETCGWGRICHITFKMI